MTHRHIIAILRGISNDEIISACRALIDAGITMIEVPLNSPDAIKSIGMAAGEFSHEALIGAGTVLSVEDVTSVAGVGGQFVVSPDTNAAVIRATREAGLASYPGVFSPSDAFEAIRSGANGLKFFPAEVLGPRGIKAMKAVLPPDMPVYAVGGAEPGNFAEYFAAGCTGFGLGSYLYKPGIDVDTIGERARAAVAAYDGRTS
ncbi:2-dehydro-3-deoxy-6-phosphogalactonate aldolase [Devosia pacifica]|uniref:2-dehydro-3-deoxy-6-phosphogalactonate aldolase n=1 Tax=Devosia pacifica TaxID=1335967 RepID=A0A918RVV4_9HYPH|nr:2-dehydro-3-deoxy-6-phosphogalactonate aldolase [Devosia pacifica]GHA10744.1 2-dehydro-3-deoxy-6-phosphogalactonate aldolase [Devosia pacifica]